MKKFFGKLAGFMYSRYGIDETYYLLLGLWFVFAFLSVIFRGWVRWVLTALQLIVLIFATFRTMSKNVARRRKENEPLRRIIQKHKAAKLLRKSKKRDKKTHIYCKCKKCRSVLRLPRVKGEHTVVCPRCHEKFKIKVKR